ncbi:MAG: NAD-dependent epimerase/dehydratase family protein [Planctomycetaceae bacterium]|nr:NAD-dependent epimerase/dehydratase family protein [Planctomycetaceae bacterium]
MVNLKLVTLAAALPPQRVLVTGGSGFLGAHVARALAAAGHQVTACGRNPYRVPFRADGPKFVRVDLAQGSHRCKAPIISDRAPLTALDRGAIHDNHTQPFSGRSPIQLLCEAHDLVVHCGALAAPWGPRVGFVSANIDGTQQIVDACRSQSRRLIHVSSTAIHFDFRDAHRLTESAPLASPFACDYAWSKAEAEAIVRQGIEQGLEAVIVRARAIFGPGDNSLLPRLLEAADAGRLKQIGSRTTQTDLTYVDNLVAAILLLAGREQLSGTYTITNDEPVELWPFVERILAETGRGPLRGSVPRGVALTAARAMEFRAQLVGGDSEPPLTRYAVGLLSTTKTFDISAAKSDLGYRPLVTVEDGVQRTLAALKATDESHSHVHVGLQLFTTGYTTAQARHAERGGDRQQQLRFHAAIAVIEHPVHGLTLFDTGYSPRFFTGTARWPYRFYRTLTPVVTSERLAAVNLLPAHGIDPGDIRRIVLSHFHADHTCGLRDFPGVDVIASERCWQGVRGRRGLAALQRAFVPDLMPPDLQSRLFTLDQFHDPGLGPFVKGHDLFADGTVRLFDLSGHAPGQLGALIQCGPHERVFLAADAVWTSRTFREPLRATLPFRLLAASARQAEATIQRLHQLHRDFPDIEVVPTHCPEVADRYRFDEMVARFA